MSRLPKQNRVATNGEIVADSHRGMWLGNRGILHDAGQQIIRPYQVQRWIYCRLQFKGRQRQIMRPGQYTELFFLDEATALAAGHRPCFECQHDRAIAFQMAWQRAHDLPALPTAAQMDRQLHQERLTGERRLKDKRKRTFTAVLSSLPDGVMVAVEERPYLWWQSALYLWTFAGYETAVSFPVDQSVAVLTPLSIVQLLQFDFTPQLHSSIVWMKI